MQDCELLDVLSNKRVLCLEDEPGILKNIIESLQLFFGEVVGVKDGLEVVKKIRAAGISVPIVILSSHTEQEYLWRAVELKITRYLPKPYDKNAFIKALQDVAAELINHAPIFSINDELKYDFAKKIIYVKDSACHLSKSESKLLEYFLARKNQTVTYEQLFDYMWEFEQPSKEAIKAIVKELRRKIGKDVIKNLYAVGYLFEV
nr:winged helix-turn-helix domain-containing protein [uncultured Campylobacter sp.]